MQIREIIIKKTEQMDEQQKIYFTAKDRRSADREAGMPDYSLDRFFDGILKILCVLIGSGSLIAGIYSGMVHCFFFAAMCAALYWAIRHEEDK